MRTAQLYEEEVAREDAELNLGMGSLIGIFFGLALVCGVFFGFGYMMGHRTPGRIVAAESLYVAPQPQAVAPKPSAQVASDPAEAQRVIVPTAVNSGEAVLPARQLVEAAGRQQTAPQRPVAQKQQSLEAVTAPPVPVATKTAEPAGNLMVQIAAVRNRTDAEALIAALRRNGFDPTIRAETQDKLLHVQVGPFDSREQAKSMRQKLSSAGYNAFIK